jgi:tetratricopeptide (TPR) repeat protein
MMRELEKIQETGDYVHPLIPFTTEEKVVKSEKCTPRDIYYYAREFYYRRDYKRAIEIFKEYIDIATWIPEKADAYLYLARSYFSNQQGDEARKACMEAIVLNPDFKEALLFMAELHFEPWKHNWEKLASVTSSEGVLFKRV